MLVIAVTAALLLSANGAQSSNIKILEDEFPAPGNQISLFKKFIVGNFDNQRQVDQEKRTGQIEHPFARHISDIANSKISNIPADFKGFFILEESYYTNLTSGTTTASPFLFYFDESSSGAVQISSYNLPKTMPPSEYRNNNSDLHVDFGKDLTKSSVFKTSVYQYSEADQSFSLDSKTDIAPGVFFVLQETISAKQLSVFEQFSSHGQVMPSYKSAIIYDRT
jgi:hypothetical protein